MANGDGNPVKLAVAGWRCGLAAIRSMPWVALTAWMLLVVLYLLFQQYSAGMNYLAFALPRLLLIPAGQIFANILLRAVSAAVFILYCGIVVPLLIAVHRYVQLGEITRRYSIDHFSARYGRYYGVVFLLSLIWQSSLALAVRPLLIKVMAYAPFYLMNIFFMYSVGFVVISAVVTLLPAIAIDAREAALPTFWRDALKAAKDHIWRLLAVLALATIPMMALRVASVWLVVLISRIGIYEPFAFIMALDLAQFVLAIAVYAAIASLLYREFDGRADSTPQALA